MVPMKSPRRRRCFAALSFFIVAASVPVAVTMASARNADDTEVIDGSGDSGTTGTTIPTVVDDPTLTPEEIAAAEAAARAADLAELQSIVGSNVTIDPECSASGQAVMRGNQVISFGPAAVDRVTSLLAPITESAASFGSGGGGSSTGVDPVYTHVVAENAEGTAALVQLGDDVNLSAAAPLIAASPTIGWNHVLSPQPGMKWKPEGAPKTTTKTPTVFASGGKGQVIALLDTGMPAGTGQGILSVGVPEIWDANGDKIADHPFDGHGLFNATLVKGLVPEATVVSVNIRSASAAATGLTDEWAFYEGVVKALAGDPARNVPPAKIINASVGSYACNGIVPVGLLKAVEAIRKADAVLVAAMGNERVQDAEFYPAAFSCTNTALKPNVLAVSALDFDQFKFNPAGDSIVADRPIAPFSNIGKCDPIFASGTNVISQWIDGAKWKDAAWNGGKPIGKVVEWQGTSMAAPIVAAQLARVARDSNLTPDKAIAVLKQGAARPTTVLNANGSRSAYSGTGKIVIVTPPARPAASTTSTTASTTTSTTTPADQCTVSATGVRTCV
jgi:Subtilase family